MELWGSQRNQWNFLSLSPLFFRFQDTGDTYYLSKLIVFDVVLEKVSSLADDSCSVSSQDDTGPATGPVLVGHLVAGGKEERKQHELLSYHNFAASDFGSLNSQC